jgi:predicted amidohydrolase
MKRREFSKIVGAGSLGIGFSRTLYLNPGNDETKSCTGNFLSGESMSKPQETKVAAIAMHSEMGNPEANLARIDYWCERASKQGAQFAIFTEECITGSMNKSDLPFREARKIAEEAQIISEKRLVETAKNYSVTIAAGTIEPYKNKFLNSLLIAGPEGFITKYSKLHLPNPNEREWFYGGDSFPIVKSQGWIFGAGICYDLRFAEIYRTAGLNGADFFLLAVAGSGLENLVKADNDQTEQALMHKELSLGRLKTNAEDNGMYIFYANQAGKSGNAWFPGLCMAFDPEGKLIDEHMPDEGMIVTKVCRETIEKARAGMQCTLSYLRQDVYAKAKIVEKRV